jgi:hypothetical protein
MVQNSCLAHRYAVVADARARMNGAASDFWLAGFVTTFGAITKPYAHQRPSGTPPG